MQSKPGTKRHLMSREPGREVSKLPRIAMTETLPVPVKSESDKKEYRYIQLPNGLRALLVDSTHAVAVVSTEDAEDSEGDDDDAAPEDDEEVEDENLAACSLMIDVGSFSDPRKIQGLAHFLEHMIFMGSKKFPSENEFDSYINKCGGSDNADTDCEETSFYFEVTENHLEGALERFSALFTEPLMSRDAMGREKQAVHSEFQTKINHEGSRREQLFASLGNAEHPCSTFTWGNLQTLKEGITDDELYTEVHKFRERHYSSHRMYVCLQARRSLNELQELVEKNFQDIPCNNLPGDDFSSFNAANAFKPEFSSKVFYVKAKSDVNRIDLSWVVPPLLDKYKTKPEEYLACILGHEGEGSLCSYLRRNLLAVDVHAGTDFSGFETNSMYAFFTVAIMLTEKGLAEVEKVLEAVFAFIKLLKREPIDEDFFREIQQIEANKFKFQVEKQALDNVEEFVTNLKYYEPQDVLGGSSLFYAFDEQQIRTLIDQLNTRSFNVMITTFNPVKGISYDRKETWFGTEYGCTDFPEHWLELWNSQDIIKTLHLPPRNEFIPTDFEIISNVETPQHPMKIIDTQQVELWYRADDKFKLPHAFMYFYLKSDLPQHDARSMASLNLMSLIFRFYLAESFYPAKETGLEYQMYSGELGFVFKVSGFSHKIHLVIEKYAKFLKNFPETIELGVFDILKTQLKKNYRNSFITTKQMSKDLRLLHLQEIYFTSYAKHQAIEDITFDELRVFSTKFIKNLRLQALVQGNLSEEKAKQVTQNFIDTLNFDTLTQKLEPRTKKIPLGERYLRVNSLRPNDFNTTVTNYYQLGLSSIKLTAKLDLLIALMEEPLFDTLRTKEQLGYDVSVSVKDTFGILGYTIVVHSQENKHRAIEVDTRIEKFRQTFLKDLSEMPEDDFETAKCSLIKLKGLPDTELSEELTRNWAEVTECEYIFDRRWKEVEALQGIGKTDMIGFYEELLKETRKLSIQVIGCIEVDEKAEGDRKFEILPQENGLNCVQDLDTFKNSLETFPVHKTIC